MILSCISFDVLVEWRFDLCLSFVLSGRRGRGGRFSYFLPSFGSSSSNSLSTSLQLNEASKFEE